MLIPVNFQQFASSALTAAVACSTNLLKNVTTGLIADAALFSVGGSSGAIRWRDDGAEPTATAGQRLPFGVVPYLYKGDLQKVKFIADTLAGNADLSITYVKDTKS